MNSDYTSSVFHPNKYLCSYLTLLCHVTGNVKLVHWLLMDGLLLLGQHDHNPLSCTKCIISPIEW